ncbi:MAG TPA: hypothetical protein PKL78_08835 [Anaerolineales bacterium]|nr:hypothetical protein [Anaerolineales bacterium]HNN13649.1 hypothetical protein [Anaerolineales bacterium]HNO31070.1 hypothetical protein [Anaerolineales bacterium]
MAKGGRRYPLVIYTHMLNRWYPAVLALGLALFGLAWVLYRWGFEQWRWLGLASVGAVSLFFGVLLFILRKAAYVQPFSDHLKLATPFLRLNISYKRIRRAASSNMGALFPPKSVSRWQQEIIQPVAKMTAIVIELTSLPMSNFALRLFLSPLFFKDKTPHFVLLVDDWMRFSAEMESYRSGGTTSAPQKKSDSSILSKLPRK